MRILPTRTTSWEREDSFSTKDAKISPWTSWNAERQKIILSLAMRSRRSCWLANRARKWIFLYLSLLYLFYLFKHIFCWYDLRLWVFLSSLRLFHFSKNLLRWALSLVVIFFFSHQSNLEWRICWVSVLRPWKVWRHARSLLVAWPNHAYQFFVQSNIAIATVESRSKTRDELICCNSVAVGGGLLPFEKGKSTLKCLTSSSFFFFPNQYIYYQLRNGDWLTYNSVRSRGRITHHSPLTRYEMIRFYI